MRVQCTDFKSSLGGRGEDKGLNDESNYIRVSCQRPVVGAAVKVLLTRAGMTKAVSGIAKNRYVELRFSSLFFHLSMPCKSRLSIKNPFPKRTSNSQRQSKTCGLTRLNMLGCSVVHAPNSTYPRRSLHDIWRGFSEIVSILCCARESLLFFVGNNIYAFGHFENPAAEFFL